MTGLPPAGTPPSPEPEPDALGAARRRRLTTGLAVIVGACVIMAAAALALAVLRDDNGASDLTAPGPAPPPGDWDPRLEPIAAFVADARDLSWERPVAARFETDEDFAAELADENGELSEETEEQLGDTQRQMEALSLLPAGVDLLDVVEETAATSVLAYYAPESEEIVVRGLELDAARRATLAHELTHALQDQHFDLEQLQDDASERGNAGGVRSVVEGDAARIEREYVESLPSDERAAYAEQSAQTGTDVAEALNAAEVPEVVKVSFGSAYAVGPPFVDVTIAVDGSGAVDDLFRPDIGEADVLTPLRFLEGVEQEVPGDVEVPDGAEQVSDQDEFGALSWYFTLAARLAPATALEAVDGWNGDRAVSYEDGGVPCVAARFVGRSAADTDRMVAALEAWAEPGPVDAARVERQDGDAVLRACARGEVVGPERSLVDALTVASTRSTIFAELIPAAPDEGAAWCLANAVVFDPELAPLLVAPTLTAGEQALLTERLQSGAADCAPG